MQRKAAATLALLVLFGNQAHAIPIFVDTSGRGWLDLNETRFRSWNDTAAVCDPLSGGCSGILGTHTSQSDDIDITGFQWATRDEVRALFYEVAGLPPGSLDAYSAEFPIGSGFGANAFKIFDPTVQLDVGPGVQSIYNGLTRSTYLGTDDLLRGISGIVANPPVGSDSFTLTGGLPVNTRENSMGVFLYKATAVPEPDTLVLFAAGLLGMALIRARRREVAGIADACTNYD